MLDFLTLIPPQYRKWVYALIGLASFAVGIWKASDGDWMEFLWSLIVSTGAATAGKNVNGTSGGDSGNASA